MKRRTFISAAAASGLTPALGLAQPGTPAPVTVAVVMDLADPAMSEPPVKWAVAELLSRLQSHKIDTRFAASVTDTTPTDIRILICGPTLKPPATMPGPSRPPAAAESFAITDAGVSARRATIVAGRDARGIVYGVLELIDRLEHEPNPALALRVAVPIREQPANRIRSVLKAFVSEVEDKVWYYDRGAWRDYLTMLATHRFNRFNLSFGIGYDFVNEIRDSYFHFTYPFLLKVPGYDVQVAIIPPVGGKVTMLSDDERDRNLDLLQYISAATVERGMEFQLGLWTHAWNFDDAPAPSHKIKGLTAATHAAYCRDALQALLVACPAISGVTLRTHGESGVPEQSYPFWKTVFAGITAVGRKIEIDQHAKGIDAEMIGLAHATGMPTTVSPKYWAEHMGLPYHQAAIRPTEMPKAGAVDAKGALMSLSNGSRNFMRYGYGDLLRDDRKHAVLHRMWPGTQRFLLWGDPMMAAACGRASSFAGTDGVEWMEPLTFKGRKGSGRAGGRDGYAGMTSSDTRDWEKYLYSYRVWGRSIYNPGTSPDARKRYLKKALGTAADSTEAALALSSRILPTVTTAHMPSAANANYWPEIYTNQSIVVADAKDPYSDTPSPKRFGTVSPLDPQLFCTIDECAEGLIQGSRDARYSPLEVAAWLEDMARGSGSDLVSAAQMAGKGPEFRKWSVDISIQNNLGRFFAAKFRAGVLYGIFTRTADAGALEEAVKAYENARAAWKGVVDLATNVYRPDLTFGYLPQLRGTWRDRLAAIDADIVAMKAATTSAAPVQATAMVVTALATPRRTAVALTHVPVKKFRAGTPVVVEASLPAGMAGKMTLWYRQVNQSVPWVSVPMVPDALSFRGAIPGEYAGAVYSLQYYFEVRLESGEATVWPGLPRDYSVEPYFLVRRG